MRPAQRADSSAVLFVPNVKFRMETQHFFPPLSLKTCYGRSLLFQTKVRTVTPKDPYDYKCKVYVFAYRPCVIRRRHTDRRHV